MGCAVAGGAPGNGGGAPAGSEHASLKPLDSKERVRAPFSSPPSSELVKLPVLIEASMP